MSWSTVVGTVFAASTAAAALLALWKLLASRFDAVLRAARLADLLAAERAGHDETKRAMKALELSHAQLKVRYLDALGASVASVDDAEAVRLAGGDPGIGDGLLDPFADDPVGEVDAGPVVSPG